MIDIKPFDYIRVVEIEEVSDLPSYYGFDKRDSIRRYDDYYYVVLRRSENKLVVYKWGALMPYNMCYRYEDIKDEYEIEVVDVKHEDICRLDDKTKLWVTQAQRWTWDGGEVIVPYKRTQPDLKSSGCYYVSDGMGEYNDYLSGVDKPKRGRAKKDKNCSVSDGEKHK